MYTGLHTIAYAQYTYALLPYILFNEHTPQYVAHSLPPFA